MRAGGPVDGGGCSCEEQHGRPHQERPLEQPPKEGQGYGDQERGENREPLETREAIEPEHHNLSQPARVRPRSSLRCVRKRIHSRRLTVLSDPLAGTEMPPRVGVEGRAQRHRRHAEHDDEQDEGAKAHGAASGPSPRSPGRTASVSEWKTRKSPMAVSSYLTPRERNPSRK